jgi:hypothetical protein
VGSAGVAGWIAQIAFVVLVIVGWDDLGVKGRVTFVALWVAGWQGLPYVAYGELFFTPFVAILDIALVFVVFKGDVTLH